MFFPTTDFDVVRRLPTREVMDLTLRGEVYEPDIVEPDEKQLARLRLRLRTARTSKACRRIDAAPVDGSGRPAGMSDHRLAALNWTFVRERKTMKRTVIALSWLAVVVAGPAWSAGCESRDILVVEMTPAKRGDGYALAVNGAAVPEGSALDIIRRQCARNLVALVHPDISFRQLSDLPFFYGKIGVRVNAQNFFVFVASAESMRMTYLPTQATIQYTNDPDKLRQLIASPPVKDNFL